MTVLNWHGRTYTAENRGTCGIRVHRVGVEPVIASNEGEALRWLCSMSLRKGKARKLLKEELEQIK